MALPPADPLKKKAADRILIVGKPELSQCDNKVISARYTAVTFLPVAILEQFRRFANLYFLVIGLIMFAGTYTTWFESAISPWTTLGPLAVVVSISLMVEGNADYKRHKNDEETNNAKCVILRRADELEKQKEKATKKQDIPERDATIMGGRDVQVNVGKEFTDTLQSTKEANPADIVKVAFEQVRRKNIRQGHYVLVKNREMVPADIILLASSNDQGCAYIETSSIDGETNLKLRTSPHIPKKILQALRDGEPPMGAIEEATSAQEEEGNTEPAFETIDAAVKRLTRMSYLGRPEGISALYHPSVKSKNDATLYAAAAERAERRSSVFDRLVGRDADIKLDTPRPNVDHRAYVAALTSEPPNASVHTFSGKLTFPPFTMNSPCYEIPLGAENVLLRGAVVRNTEWVIGLAFFTGPDTKLVQNSFKTPSKFSQLDVLMNKTVLAILFVMILIVSYLATQAVFANDNTFETLFYAGYNTKTDEPWPYLPNLEPPAWETTTSNWIQFFLLYVTLMNNFIPLSLYVTVEMVTWCMLWFVYADIEMYDDTTNTRAVARSTIVSDLGRIQYIFSDKTGTLTQNVMRFKRCSVDGMVFGAPITRTRPGAPEPDKIINTNSNDDDDEDQPSAFHPLRALLVGKFKRQPGLEGMGGTLDTDVADDKLTFNAEMFCRTLSLCHTVVVEKDIDKKTNIDSALSTTSKGSDTKSIMSMFKRKRADTGSSGISSPLSSVAEASVFSPDDKNGGGNRARTSSVNSLPPGQDPEYAKNHDGAPLGYAYQAESPDEGALVSAASSAYNFQVIGRDSSGIRLRVATPSHLQDMDIIKGLQNKTKSLKRLAAESASEAPYLNKNDDGDDAEGNGGAESLTGEMVNAPKPENYREETWSILAVNKFDSDRKRMSILLRSPPELGNLPILFCKGADSSMLDADVCENFHLLQAGHQDAGPRGSKRVPESERDVSALTTVSEDNDEDSGDVNQDEWEMAQMLGIQVHLGEFAKEGLRTLVLGMKVLTEQECTEWLELYKTAATSMEKRGEMLTEAAKQIETGLHIVGATAIEDKLQKNVPETIATLENAGIKLWVLTGDKRETAVEIGYSTHVLTNKMHLTEVPDEGKHHVRTQMAMEFIRLTKIGRLPNYQKAALEEEGKPSFGQKLARWKFKIGICRRSFRRFILTITSTFFRTIGMSKAAAKREAKLKASLKDEETRMLDIERRRKVRARAEKTIRTWIQSEAGAAHRQSQSNISMKRSQEEIEIALTSEEVPAVFSRATSARGLLSDMRNSGQMTESELRRISLAHHTATQVSSRDIRDKPLVDEDTLSLESFVPTAEGDLRGDYDKKKRTLLERMFAIDREVRKGRLMKHMTKERRREIAENKVRGDSQRGIDPAIRVDSARALVIEGAALKHLLGEPEFEEILFAVASNCDAVIACRVSPKQKAELVNLVRQNIRPEPITLAIGDGANDVGMIQEAHVGIGISGKEGKQAVNASDFAIAQFRFLENLILIHGRWNFFRLSSVVLFSFYKNTVMAGLLVFYTSRTVYSGTPLFDEWVIAMLNFVAAWPIIMTGLFDRCLSKDYVRSHPEVFKATRENELITFRTLFRWICLVFIHTMVLYYCTVPQLCYGGGITSAFVGLMRNRNDNYPGDGEGGDLKSVGTVTYSCLIIMLAYKVLFETKSLVHGRWPSVNWRCSKDAEENFFSRAAYTWIGVTFMSIFFYFFAICTYQIVGRKGASQFSGFVDVANHVLGMRSISWILMAFVPIFAMIIDVVGKLFSNMFYPTQTQVHLEIEAKQKMRARMQGELSPRQLRRRNQMAQMTPP